MDPRMWDAYDGKQQHFRHRNTLSRGMIHVVDDTGATQILQAEFYATELRDGMQRLGHFGFGSVPLPGASIAATHQGGDRGMATIIGIEDTRYRPTGFKGGESYGYMVDGAAADGTGGTLRMLWQGLIGWAQTIFGKTITIGDANLVTCNIGTAATSLTINLGSTEATVNIVGGSGDVIVRGVSLFNHVHSNSGGSGDSGPPVAS